MSAVRRIRDHIDAHLSEWAANVKRREEQEKQIAEHKRKIQDADRTALAEKFMDLLHVYMKNHNDDWESSGCCMELLVARDEFWPRDIMPSAWDTPHPDAPKMPTAEDRVVNALIKEGVGIVAPTHMWGNDFKVQVSQPPPPVVAPVAAPAPAPAPAPVPAPTPASAPVPRPSV
jgi:hypothetical protein